jgi:hypothetical protein
MAMTAKNNYRRIYRVYLEEVPESPAGLEVRCFNDLLQLIRWRARELVITSTHDLTPESLSIIFYVKKSESREGIILEKVEGKIERIELLRTTSYR